MHPDAMLALSPHVDTDSSAKRIKLHETTSSALAMADAHTHMRSKTSASLRRRT